MINTDKIAIESQEEAEAFNLIDSTAQQVEQLTTGKPKAIGRFVIEYDAAEMAKFGDYIVSKTCEEILKAVEGGISQGELAELLKAAISSSSESAGV